MRNPDQWKQQQLWFVEILEISLSFREKLQQKQKKWWEQAAKFKIMFPKYYIHKSHRHFLLLNSVLNCRDTRLSSSVSTLNNNVCDS